MLYSDGLPPQAGQTIPQEATAAAEKCEGICVSRYIYKLYAGTHKNKIYIMGLRRTFTEIVTVANFKETDSEQKNDA